MRVFQRAPAIPPTSRFRSHKKGAKADSGLWDMIIKPGLSITDPENAFSWSEDIMEMLPLRSHAERRNPLHAFLGILCPAHREQVSQALTACLKDKTDATVFDCEFPVQDVTGADRSFRATAEVERNENGEPTPPVGMFHDIEDRRRA